MKHTIIFTTAFYVIVQAVLLVVRLSTGHPERLAHLFFPTIIFACIAALFLLYRMLVRKDRKKDGDE